MQQMTITATRTELVVQYPDGTVLHYPVRDGEQVMHETINKVADHLQEATEGVPFHA